MPVFTQLEPLPTLQLDTAALATEGTDLAIAPSGNGVPTRHIFLTQNEKQTVLTQGHAETEMTLVLEARESNPYAGYRS